MNYVKFFNLLGVEAQQIPCITGEGAPTTTTEGAVGCFYMDTDSDNGDIYKCTNVANGVFTWVLVEGTKGEDGITPHIGANGNWYVGDTDTGVRAEGATVVQTTGESETAVMSQKATTDYVKDYIPKAQSRNLAPTIWENALINTSGDYYPRTDGLKYAASPEFIEVVGGMPYTFSWYKGYSSCTCYIYQYRADKSYIKSQNIAGMNAANTSPTTKTLDAECAYIRIGIQTWLADIAWETLLPEKFQIEQGSTKTEYVLPKVIDSNYIDYSPLIETATKTDYLYGKKLVACGDSITDAWNGEAGSGYYESYAEITAKRHGMIFAKNAVSGSTMAYNADGNSPISTNAFSNTRYLNLPEFDYLTIWFGWNDHAYSEVGTIEDTDNTTFYGAYKIVLEHLITNNPTKKIGLVVPYGIKSTKMEAIAQAVRDISKMYGVPCLDLRDYNECSGFWGTDNDVQLAKRAALTYDTTHPNQVGHEYLSTMYENFIKRL